MSVTVTLNRRLILCQERNRKGELHTNLSSTSVWGEEIDDLDTGHENLSGGRLLSEWWSIGVDGSTAISLDWATLINWVTSDVHDATKSLWADWDGDWSTGIVDAVATDETLSTYSIVLVMLC